MGMRIMKIIITLALIFISSLSGMGCSANESRIESDHLFNNGYGNIISISPRGTIINKVLYRAYDCSTRIMRCVKYGSLFAIVVPFSCPVKDATAYLGYAAGIHSFIISFTPHDRSSIQLSTSYGDGLSFGYQGDKGVTNLYYDPTVRLGNKDIWLGLEYVDLKKVRYTEVSKTGLFPCS